VVAEAAADAVAPDVVAAGRVDQVAAGGDQGVAARPALLGVVDAKAVVTAVAEAAAAKRRHAKDRTCWRTWSRSTASPRS
jgi:hypothetical protein